MGTELESTGADSTAAISVRRSGAFGSMARYGVGLALPSIGFPYATLAVNVIGCFAIGLVLPTMERAVALPQDLRLLVVVGFLGGFTTFSAFIIETVGLLSGGQVLKAMTYALVSVVASLAATRDG